MRVPAARTRIALALILATVVLALPPPSTALGLHAEPACADDLLPPFALESPPAPVVVQPDEDVLLPPALSWRVSSRRAQLGNGLELLAPGYLQRPHRRPRQLVAGVGGFAADAILPPGNLGSGSDAQGVDSSGSGMGAADDLLPPAQP